MMPIFFNITSHLWIAYLFFLNGLLIHYLLRTGSAKYRSLTELFEGLVLASFFISISVNGVLLVVFDTLGLSFIRIQWILIIVSVVGMIFLIPRALAFGLNTVFKLDVSVLRLLLYFFVFVVLFYNGALIEQVSDAWWHMSLANKIGLENSFVLQQGHLNGVSSRYYPPLWHGNLALAKLISGQSLPVLWNSFTAWGGVLKVMGFFLVALSLSKSKTTAFVSALLFVLLPGLGYSYLRVSAWPSHIAYSAWFLLIYVAFSLLDVIKRDLSSVYDQYRAFIEQPVHCICFFVLALVVAFSHQLELLLFTLSFLFYFIGISVYRVFASSRIAEIECSTWSIQLIGQVLMLGSLVSALWFLYRDWSILSQSVDLFIAYLLPVAVLLVVFYSLPLFSKLFVPVAAKVLVLLTVAALILSVDLRHFLSLFNPSLAYPKSVYLEWPLVASGWFGGDLNIPGWHLQLRSGLLYSGVLAIPLSLGLAYVKPSRMTVFLAANTCLAFLFCASPYLYHWFREGLDYHSPWRISMLIFHPIVIAACLTQLAPYLLRSRKV